MIIGIAVAMWPRCDHKDECEIRSKGRRFEFEYAGGALPHLHLSTRRKIALGVGAILATATAGVASVHHFVAFDRSVEITLRARPGAASVELRRDLAGGMSPACGCADPAFAERFGSRAHLWIGHTIPTNGFELGFAGGREWSLDALNPGTGEVVKWFADPSQPIRVHAEYRSIGNRKVLFSGRTSELKLIGLLGSVSVSLDKSKPYAALVPASGGEIKFASRPAARPSQGAS